MKKQFMEEEVICDFKVDANRKKLWKIQIDMLLFVKEVCKKYDIDYFLHSGSALGAVRHKGFIPWDDDLDLGMLRKDFDKFLAVAPKEIKEPLFIQYGLNDGGHICGLLRIRNSNTTGIIRVDKDKDCNNGVYIEIYPFDNVPDNILIRKLQNFLSLFLYHGLLANYYGPLSKRQYIALQFVKLFGVNKLYIWWQHICKWANNNEARYVDTNSLPDYVKEGIYKLERNWVIKTKEVPFEYTTARVPVAVDEILKQNFGDYWQLPPREERGLLHRKTVFFDPNKPYIEYKNSEIVNKYFEI